MVTGRARLRDLHPQLRPWAEWLVQVAVAQGWDVRITSVRRSVREQQMLYSDWIRGRRLLPAAKPGCSQHQYGLAWDMVINEDHQGPFQRAIGGAWREAGGSWPGPTDPVHFGVFWTPPSGCGGK
jgi:LAS superfamily LD-carboxypeptidase LdcB